MMPPSFSRTTARSVSVFLMTAAALWLCSCRNGGAETKAIAECKARIQGDPGNAQGYIDLGRLLCRGGFPALGLKAFQEALAVNTQQAREILRRRPRQYLAQKCLEEAMREYYLVLVIDPGDVVARMELAQVLINLGMAEDARRQYEVVVRTAPQNADAWFDLGVLFEAQGNRPKAAECYRKVLAIDPRDQDVRRRLEEIPNGGPIVPK